MAEHETCVLLKTTAVTLLPRYKETPTLLKLRKLGHSSYDVLY